MSINLSIKHGSVPITDISSGTVTLQTGGKYCEDNLSFTLTGVEYWEGDIYYPGLCFTANTAGSTISFPKLFEYSTDGIIWNTPSTAGTSHTGWNDDIEYMRYADEIYHYIDYEVRAESAEYHEAVMEEFSSIKDFDNFLMDDRGWSQSQINMLTTMPPARAATITLPNAGDKIYVRNGTVGTISEAIGKFIMTGSISASGNIMSLLDNTCESLIIPCSECFYNTFYFCTSLTTPPELPATNLAEGCYKYMFNGCTSLISAPVLPATTLANECYRAMFYGCNSLTTAPALPATTLPDYCYASMFHGCTSLIVSSTQTVDAPHVWIIPTERTFTNTCYQVGTFFLCAGTRESDTISRPAGQSCTYYTQNEPV